MLRSAFGSPVTLEPSHINRFPRRAVCLARLNLKHRLRPEYRSIIHRDVGANPRLAILPSNVTELNELAALCGVSDVSLKPRGGIESRKLDTNSNLLVKLTQSGRILGRSAPEGQHQARYGK